MAVSALAAPVPDMAVSALAAPPSAASGWAWRPVGAMAAAAGTSPGPRSTYSITSRKRHRSFHWATSKTSASPAVVSWSA